MRKNFAIAALLLLLLVGYLALLGRLMPHPNEPSSAHPTQQIWPAKRQSFLFDLAPMPQLRRGEVSQGTAFNVDGAGLWLTARHVVSPCLAGNFRGNIGSQNVTLVSADGHNDVAVLHTGKRQSARGGLPVAYFNQDRVDHASIVGFPASRPAEVSVQRIGSGQARSTGNVEAVSVWVIESRSPAGDYPLSGMSGAPVLDDLHNVVGVLSAEVPRRGRVLVAQIADWIAGEGQHIVPARTFSEEVPMGELVGQLTDNGAIARIHCSS